MQKKIYIHIVIGIKLQAKNKKSLEEKYLQRD